MDYKKELLALYKKHLDLSSSATAEQRLQAQIDDTMIGGKELDDFLMKDYSDDYNDGTLVDSFPEPARTDYANFIKAFNLPKPTGKPVEDGKEFNLDDYLLENEDS